MLVLDGYLKAGPVLRGLLMLQEGGEAADSSAVIGSLLHGRAGLQELSKDLGHRLQHCRQMEQL